jgi:DNA-binding NtrC family response regulator
MATNIQYPIVQSSAAFQVPSPSTDVPEDDRQRLRALVRASLSNLDRMTLENIIYKAYGMGNRRCHHAMSQALAEEMPLHLDTLERKAIERAFARTHGDATRTAKLLGIGKTSIYRKLRKYGMMSPQYQQCPNCGYKLHSFRQQ